MDKQIPLLGEESKDEQQPGDGPDSTRPAEGVEQPAELDFSTSGETPEQEAQSAVEPAVATEKDLRFKEAASEDEDEFEDNDDDDHDDEEDEEDEEVFAARGEGMNQPEELQQYEEEDPLGGGFDLDHGNPLDVRPTQLPWQSDVSSPKEFFNTEMLYRFDIVEPEDREHFEGTYRIELKGHQGGVWTITVGKDLEVVNRKEDAEIVLSMSQKDFMELVNGKLNPQLAILAQKVKIQGDVKKALLFQALIAPTVE